MLHLSFFFEITPILSIYCPVSSADGIWMVCGSWISSSKSSGAWSKKASWGAGSGSAWSNLDSSTEWPTLADWGREPCDWEGPAEEGLGVPGALADVGRARCWVISGLFPGVVFCGLVCGGWGLNDLCWTF